LEIIDKKTAHFPILL